MLRRLPVLGRPERHHPETTVSDLSLAPDGLGYVASQSSLRRLPFRDTDRETVLRVLRAALGPVTEQPLPDCGAAITFVGRAGSGAVFRSDAGPVTTRATAAGLEFDTGADGYTGLAPGGTETGALSYLAAGTGCGPH